MTRPTLRLAAASVALLPLGMLAGCGQDAPEPTSEDPTSAEPSESDSKSPEEPVEPEPPAAMDRDDEAAAQAFVKYYFDVFDHALRSHETKVLRQLSSPSCRTCGGVARIIDTTRRNDGQISGGEHTVKSVALNALDATEGVRTYRGNMKVWTTEQTIEGSGLRGVDGDFPAGTRSYAIVLVHDTQGWQFADWRTLS